MIQYNFNVYFNLWWNNYEKSLAQYPLSNNRGQRDLRVTIFGMSVNVLSSYGSVIEMKQKNFKDPAYWKAKNIHTSADISLATREFDVCADHGYFILFISRIEWNLRNMLVNVKPGACNDGLGEFKNIYDCLFKEINTQHLSGMFDIARHLRNLIHNNGHYCHKEKKNSAPINYRGVTYNFEHGKLVNSATELSFMLYEDLAKACAEIVNTPKIFSFKEMYDVIPTS